MRGLRVFLVVVLSIGVALPALLLGAPTAARSQTQPWMDPTLPPDERAELLLAAMTLEEKVELMTGDQGGAPSAYYNAPIPRLGIPELRMADAGAGIAPRGWSLPGTEGRATAMPAGIALAATFAPALVETYAGVVTDEAIATQHNLLLGPNADIIRLPWWGRSAETESEDPLLTSRIVTPFVRTVQEREVVANLKHYNVYNQETNRGSGQNSVLDERTLQEIHTRPWEAPIREAGLGSVMCSFNKVNDIFACENEELLDDILREQLGFTGFVLTDFGAIHSTIPSLIAGTDLETGTRAFYDGPLLAAVQSGQVPEAYLDRSVLRILRTMFAIGLFDRSYGPGAIPVEEHGAVARAVEEQALTLLQNDDDALPLAGDLETITVVGGDANIAAALGGASRVEPTYTVPPFDGIAARAEAAGATAQWTPGNDPVNAASMIPGPPAVPSSVFTPAGGAPGERGLRAEWFADTAFTELLEVRTERQVNPDYGFLSTFAGLNPSQVPPPPTGPTGPGGAAVGSVRYTGTFTAPGSGPYTFALTGWGDARMYFDGELLIDMTGVDGVRSVSSPTRDLVAGEPHDVLVEYATTRPRVGLEPGTLQLGWTHPDDAIAPQIQEAAAAAAAADVAVVFARTHEGEQRDRAHLTLPNEQDLLIREVVEANPRTVVVLATGGPVLMPWLDDVPAVVQSYFGGQEQGNAIASVLFGDVNPAGRLPITYPRSETDVPPGLVNPWTTEADLDVEYEEGVFVGYRGYDEYGIEPLFPFGHGLSYTSFAYRGRLGASGVSTPRHDARVSVTVENTGDVPGAEVVQVYVGELPTGVPTPPRQLAGFARVELDPGERQRVTIEVDRQSLSYWDEAAGGWVTPRGRVPVYVGSSSRDLRVEGTILVR